MKTQAEVEQELKETFWWQRKEVSKEALCMTHTVCLDAGDNESANICAVRYLQIEFEQDVMLVKVLCVLSERQ